MKKLFITITLLVLPIIVFAYKSPGRPQGFVSDYANILDSKTRIDLENKLTQFEKQSGVEIAVVTVNNLDNETVETYAVKLFEEWKIGKSGKDNGILFLIAPKEREVRIEVGYGMEGTITDLVANKIIQKDVIPQFKQNNYTQGILNGVDSLFGIIDKSIDPTIYESDSNRSNNRSLFDIIDPRIILFIIFISIGTIMRLFSKTKSWWLGGLLGGIVGLIISIFVGFIFSGLIITFILILLGLLVDFIASKRGPGGFGGTHGGFFGGFGGGHSSGGFGGFGGGFSVGGGASGRW